MKITGVTLFKIWERDAALERFRTLAIDATKPDPACSCTGAFQEAAKRVERRALAWGRMAERATGLGGHVAYAEAERFSEMRNFPYQFAVAELLAERDTLGVTERWCWTRGADAAAYTLRLVGMVRA